MQRRLVWFAVAFSSIPAFLFACAGGRTQLDVDLDESSGSAGVGGVAGAGGTAGSSGSAGASAGTAGEGGAAGTGIAGEGGAAGSEGGSSNHLCLPGQQFECPCPGSAEKGVQVCKEDGSGLDACTGCPTGAGGSAQGGSAGAGGSSGSSGAAGGGGNQSDGGDFFDSLPFPLPDSGPVGECVNCLQSQCGSAINGCYNNQNCIDGIQCAITDCFIGGGSQGGSSGGGLLGGGGSGGGLLGGGSNGVNFACLLNCFNGDIGAAYSAIQTFSCVTQTCGGQCGGDILGGDGGFPLGGLGAGGGGGGLLGGLGAGGGGFPLGGLGGGMPETTVVNEQFYIDGVRIPMPEEVPGYPQLQDALRR